jgi:hypothetical protein
VYAPQIILLGKLFGKRNIHVLTYDDLVTKKTTTCNRLLKFYNLPSLKRNVLNRRFKFNTSNINTATTYLASTITRGSLNKVREFYSPHNKILYSILGNDMDWDWSGKWIKYLDSDVPLGDIIELGKGYDL